ncbi:prepilin peptidase [Serratia sp. UGAL515B_01]|uniref:prepilin peptidase n=1 Tax=Serratia sp. UGAL515B_01 TaxID=2986763 RepID=UPI002953736C|nr:prepilin peptidase [Serratia sp. UGAL515B_01]WON76956.1 prepilin peptidase [Serratia sp. UGAL515B_01]
MYIFVMIMTFLLGTILMSFLGMLVYRMPVIMEWRETTGPHPTDIFSRSRCEYCGRVIPFIFIIPLFGYFFCRGRCYYCKDKVSLVYPFMELLGGIIFVGFFAWLGLSGIVSATLVIVLIFIAWMDFNETWIPLVVTLPLFWVGLCFSYYQSDANARVMGAALGFFVSYLSMAVISYFKKKDVVAGGDIALITCAGAWLGIDIMPEFLILVAVIFIIHAIPYRIKGEMYVPMGPAICLGFVVCIVQQLIS